MREIIPLKDSIIMERFSIKDSRILLPDDTEVGDDRSELRAILIGKEVKEIQIGDTVMINFNLVPVHTIKHEDKTYYMVKEENVTCVKREVNIEN